MAEVSAQTRRLLRVSKAPRELLANWSEGTSLASAFGLSIEHLKLKAAAERWKLALEHRREGRKLLLLPEPPYRAVVSRFYYVMYHAMRASCYLYHGGDDYEAHSVLPLNLPADFPNAATWKNTLKNARLTRNAADYDPYPKSQLVWQRRAKDMTSDADRLVAEVRAYLRKKGCLQI